MPAIGFRGFTAGVPVALLADQGAVSVGNSVASWGGTLGEIGIEVTAAASVSAPAAVWVEATGPAGFTLSTPPAGTPFLWRTTPCSASTTAMRQAPASAWH